MNTEQKLKMLFDYQKFADNPRLKCLIDAAESRTEELSDGVLSFLSAAGEAGNGGDSRNTLQKELQTLTDEMYDNAL